MGNDTADEQRTGAAGIEAAWQRFIAQLAIEVAELSPRDVLRFSGSGNRYAQFMIWGPVVQYEIVSNAFLKEGFRLSAAAEALMRERGWQRAESNHNWSRELDWSARFGNRREYHVLAVECVTALRDVLGFGFPEELERVLEQVFGSPYPGEELYLCVDVDPASGYLRECFDCGVSGEAAWTSIRRSYETGDTVSGRYCVDCRPRVGG